MRFNYRGNNYYVSWKHCNIGYEKKGTECAILLDRGPGDFEIASIGVVNLHPDDQYDKYEGRKRSLARALHKLIPRDEIVAREGVWDLFHAAILAKDYLRVDV